MAILDQMIVVLEDLVSATAARQGGRSAQASRRLIELAGRWTKAREKVEILVIECGSPCR